MNVVTRRVCPIDRPSEPMSMTALRKIADDGKPLLMRGSSLDTVINALAIGVIAAIGITLLGVTTALTAFPPTTLLGVAAGIVILSVAKHCLFNSQNAKWYKELNGNDATSAPQSVREAVQGAFNKQNIPGTLPTGLSLTGLINLTANNKDAAQALIKDLLTEIKDLSTDQIQALSPLHIQALSTDQIQALSTDQIQALSPLHIQALSTDQIQALSETQLNAINLETLTAISDSIGKGKIPEENMLLLFSSLQALHHKQFVPTGTTLEFNLEHPSLGFLQILNNYSQEIFDKAFVEQDQVDTFLSTFIPGQVYTTAGTFIDKEEHQQAIVYGQVSKDIAVRGGQTQLAYYIDKECVSMGQEWVVAQGKWKDNDAYIQSLHDKIKKKFGDEEERTLPILVLLSQASNGLLTNLLASTGVFPKCTTISSGISELRSKTVLSLENKTYTCTTTTPVRVNILNSTNSFTFTLKIENLDTQDMKNPKYTLTIQSTNPKTTLK